MEIKEIFDAINEFKNGSYITLTKTKELDNGVVKESTMNVRKGVSYANLSVNNGVDTGSLPWGQWVKGYENVVIEHKGNYYLRLTAKSPSNDNGIATDVIDTSFVKDGMKITKEEAMSICNKKFFQAPKTPTSVYSIKFSNIKSIVAKKA